MTSVLNTATAASSGRAAHGTGPDVEYQCSECARRTASDAQRNVRPPRPPATKDQVFLSASGAGGGLPALGIDEHRNRFTDTQLGGGLLRYGNLTVISNCALPGDIPLCHRGYRVLTVGKFV